MSSHPKRKRQPPGLTAQSSINGHKSPSATGEQFEEEARPQKRERVHHSQGLSMRVPLPCVSSCLRIALGGSHWYGERSLKKVVVFGDSYSKATGSSTWVDRLRGRMAGGLPQVYNFAVPAATAEHGLSDQILRFSDRFPYKAGNDTASALNPDQTLYVVFIGINDCGTNECDELGPIVEDVFDSALHDLYVKAGARNFVIFDVPPIDRSPQATESASAEDIRERVKTWNELLQTHATEFDDPLKYDFSEDDPTEEGGSIWVDELHLTSEVQDIVAEQLLKALLNTESEA
ncbi:SGNH hydrolase-type esterase domain-containing protein [Trametes punicea]|nr:SGNH hydrolase-type esterase domain-containing protein [Trametes punicea]